MISESILKQVERVSIFRDVLEDPAVKQVLHLMVQVEELSPYLSEGRAELFRRLAEVAELSDQPMIGNSWQNHLLEVILSDANVFARKAEHHGAEQMGESLRQQVESDLSALRMLYGIDLGALLDGFPSLNGFSPADSSSSVDTARLSIKRYMDSCDDWRQCTNSLLEFYEKYGTGEFARFHAFRWARRGEKGRLIGVESPDSIKFSDLVQYEWQRDSVRRNTEKLLAGLPTNNMLLYGDRGTGKSSSVKAMLNEFADRRLRLIEVAKENLIDLPEILSIIRKRPEKFILFLDDLSFEEYEMEYKALKAVLEGGLEARPINVTLYATSNRRNLIKERFSDRKLDDEVHSADTMQEKLSLADRFGIKLPFLAPDQEGYLQMVETLASRAGIEMTEEVRRQALTWQHARSGRSARQFVDYLIGEIALGS
jgi:hypothetical protein